jgi:hypothetical protein
MLASIFSKVTASLGKTYAYAGLLPAAVLMLVFSLHATSFGAFIAAGQALLTDVNSWKSVAWLGALWLTFAFVFYAVRAPIFTLFQIVPNDFVGRRLLFRRVRRREQFARKVEEVVWQKTALAWLGKLHLDRSKIAEYPYWIRRPSPEQSLSESKSGREALVAVDRTAGDALNLTVPRSDAIGGGIFRLFLIAKFKHAPEVEQAIDSEIAEWRSAFNSRRAKAVVVLVEQDIDRKFARAFQAHDRFGGGAFIFPTELGNRISALDDYALQRYGIDTATIWNRLWWILPKDAKAEVSDARLALEALVNLTVALVLAVAAITSWQISSCGAVLDFSGSTCDSTRTIAFAVCICILAAIVHRGVNFAMEILAIKTTTLIDMYRLPMLRQLGFSPKTVGDELKIHKDLKGLFTQANELDSKLELVSGKAEPKPDKPGEEPKDAAEKKPAGQEGDEEDSDSDNEKESDDKPDKGPSVV